MVAVTNLLSKYTILYGKVMTLVVTIQSVARRWTTKCCIDLRWPLPSNQSFYRQIAGYGMGVGDHRVG